MAQIDLLLLHPPSVYDFRTRAILYGPVSDLIPSSPVFEMYPLGFLTMTDYLETRGLRVRIVNLALRMMNDPHFDVARFLARLKPRAVGIDLHWLPHAHGAIEVARIVKRLHPDVPVIMGGLSSSYFHEELIAYPAVDYVLRGDSVEPPLYDLMQHILAGSAPHDVSNLTWKDATGLHVNPPTFIPDTLDYANLAPQRLVKMVLRYRDLQSVLPFNGWWQNPITAAFTVRGCAHQCVTCGNSRDACALLSVRPQPIYRSPANLVENMRAISHISRGPIFLVGDLRQAGDDFARAVLDLLRKARFQNEIVFELFSMPPEDYLASIDRSVANWSLELSPESHDEALRRRQDATVSFSNAEMEAIIQQALALRCTRVDVFFMIGLSGQTRASVMQSIDYCERLFQMTDKRLSCFISPMGPFLDPASRAFEEPERYGYHLFARTLEEHRQLLVQPSWQQILNYETQWMTRDEMAAVTYDAGEALNRLKLRYGRIAQAQGEMVAQHIQNARDLSARLDAAAQRNTPDQEAEARLRGEVNAFSVSTVCDKQELFWSRRLLNFNVWAILRLAWEYARKR
jgi:B12-binding domain/radical SAM domain protein